MFNMLQSFNIQEYISLILVIIFSYLLGSVSFSIIFTSMFLKDTDIRTLGSGNAGLTNVLRSAGKLPGILTLICDFFKGIIAVSISYLIFKTVGIENLEFLKYIEYIAGFCCILGHIYPCFFGFRGGKGVLTSVAVVFMVDWRLFVSFILVFLIVLFVSKMVSLSSILSLFSLPFVNFILLYFWGYQTKNQLIEFSNNYIIYSTILLFIIFLLVAYTHRSNINRIINGSERKIGKKRSN